MPVNAGDTILASQYNSLLPNTIAVGGSLPSGLIAYLEKAGALQLRLRDSSGGTDLKGIELRNTAHLIELLQLNDNDTIKNTPLSVSTGGVVTFSGIPIGPNSSPTVDNELARKKYVDDSIGNNVVVVQKTTNETDTTGTLQNDDELFFAVGVNEVWVGYIVLLYDSASNTPDIATRFTSPSSPTSIHSGQIGLSDAAAGTPNNNTVNLEGAVSNGTPSNIFTAGAISATVMQLIFFHFENGANAGNFQLQWSQNSANATPTTVRAGSYLIAFKKG